MDMDSFTCLYLLPLYYLSACNLPSDLTMDSCLIINHIEYLSSNYLYYSGNILISLQFT